MNQLRKTVVNPSNNPNLEMLQLNVQLNLLERAINASSNGIIITDACQKDNPIIYVNQAFEQLTGYSLNEVAGYNCRFLQGNNSQQREIAKIRRAIKQGKECYSILKNYRKDGTEFWNELYISPVRNAQGEITNFIGVQTDITERKQAEEALAQSEKQFRLVFEKAPIGMALVGVDGNFLKVNDALCETLGYSKEELLARSLLSFTDPKDAEEIRLLYQQCLQGEIQSFEVEKQYRRKDNRQIYVLLKGVLVRDENNVPLHYIVQMLDLSCQFYQETEPLMFVESDQVDDCQNLPNYVHCDGLTGLRSRLVFEKHLEQSLLQSYNCAVLFLDLDRFKVINESLGHKIGDQLLIKIASRLKNCLQENDLITRSGGDEYAILVTEIHSEQEAIAIAETFQNTLSQPFTMNTPEGEISTSYQFLTTSIGIALAGENNTIGHQLLQDAEIALGQAKQEGKGTIKVFDQSLRNSVLRKARLETDLRQAISKNQLYLKYQPIIDLTTGQLSGFEALVRWEHPELGLVSPGEFIPIAEDTGFVVPLGYWVLFQACQQLQEWQQRFPEYPELTMGVNLSAVQVKDLKLVEQVEQILQETGLAGHHLKLELTETVLIENLDLAIQQLEALKAHKIKLSIDDFGTGYASLSYLQRFPVDVLKIDRSFISAMTPDNHNIKIVQGVISLAHALEMEVVGEGIETDYQRRQLNALGCKQGQGYWFAKPLNATEATQFIKENLGH